MGRQNTVVLFQPWAEVIFCEFAICRNFLYLHTNAVTFCKHVSVCLHSTVSSVELIIRVTTCLENLEMSWNLTAVRELSGILLKVRELSGKSGLKRFIVSCIFVSIQVFSRSLFCVKY